ncbi:MAG: hypothetical protein RLY31_990 [Bacteroidota bacterium]|jgi:TrmH family RNA methyltransferase
MGLSSNLIKYIRSLHQRKFRQNYQKFIAEGTKIAVETLKSQATGIAGVYASEAWIDRHAMLLRDTPAEIVAVSEDELSRISALTTPNQVLLVLDFKILPVPPQGVRVGLNLYLDGIRDPGNLGAILRIADWFGVSAVYCTSDTVEVTNPKVVQSSMGAFLRVPCHSASFDMMLQDLPSLPVFAADPTGEDLRQQVLPEDAVLVVGNESAGISSEILRRADRRLRIPRGPGGGAESLNAAVATGILCAFFRLPAS